ncbi:hypothetical protein B0H11DRAFT_2255455 [Mycena galericulata]|nr:hypothetical protein B0H11DRAFT_2255455 [Mycena galericulata]
MPTLSPLTGTIHADLATALFPIFDVMRFEIFPFRSFVSAFFLAWRSFLFFLTHASLALPCALPSRRPLVSVLVVSPGVRSGKTGAQGRKERPLVFRVSCLVLAVLPWAQGGAGARDIRSLLGGRGRRDEGGVAGGKMRWMGNSSRRVFCTLLLLLPRAVARFLMERERERGGGGRGVRRQGAGDDVRGRGVDDEGWADGLCLGGAGCRYGGAPRGGGCLEARSAHGVHGLCRACLLLAV